MKAYIKQRRAKVVLGALAVTLALVGEVQAGVVTYTDRTSFLDAFPQANLIDFETLPDGSPSIFRAEITPEFNYSTQGVEFFAEVGDPFITGSEISGFDLSAGPRFNSSGPPNWLIIEFLEPAQSLGFTFGGDTTLTLFTPEEEFLGTWLWGGSGEFFLGIGSDDHLIASAIINSGSERQTIGNFYWSPVPEPTSLLLLTGGGLLLARRRVRARRWRERTSPGGTACPALFIGVGTVVVLFGHGIVQAQPLNQTAINLRYDTAWKINTWSQTLNANPRVLPYLWVPLTEKGQIIRVATSTFDPLTGQTVAIGATLGTYWTAPEGCRVLNNGDAGPSRTAVDFDGSVWVANRHNIQETTGGPQKGHVVKIGNGMAYQWIDRDNDGVLDTSTGTTALSWTNEDDSLCEASDVQYADDELILIYLPVPPIATRTLAVNRKNNVWVGGSYDRSHGLLDWRTGILADENGNGSADFSFQAYNCGGYGGLVDSAGILWSARGDGTSDKLLRFDPATNIQTCISITDSYGVGIDAAGYIWNSKGLQNTVSKITPSGTVSGTFTTGSPAYSKGVVSLPSDNSIWIANTSGNNVKRLSNAGATQATITAGSQTSGVAVDSSGFIWDVNRAGNTIQRINPSTNSVNFTKNLPSGSRPYAYSDMTGVPLYHTTAPAGVLATTTDEGQSVWVQGVSWTANPGGGTIAAWVRASDTLTDLGKKLYIAADNEEDILCEGVRGRYVQIRFQLNASSHNSTWPTLSDFDLLKLTTITDCNDNDVPDHCDVRAGTSLDCNLDEVPDECQLVGNDCNTNGIPDECEDCNVNGEADECDIADSTSCDEDEDGVPDECFACCPTEGLCQNLIPEECTGIGTTYAGITCGAGCQCNSGPCCAEDVCCDVVDCACTAGFAHSVFGGSCGTTCVTGACCTTTGCVDSSSGYGTVDKDFCDDAFGALRYVGGATCSGSPNICTFPVSCPAGSIVASYPADMTVDARFPHLSTDFLAKRGIGYEGTGAVAADQIKITLSDGGGSVSGANRVECWCLCEDLPDPDLGCNSIQNVESLGNGEYRIHLAQPITTHSITTITYKDSGDHVTYISHPGNVNSDSATAPSDILDIINNLNGVRNPPLTVWQCDIDRSGVCAAADILGEIDLLNGANAFDVWNGTSKPSVASSTCPSSAGCLSGPISCGGGDSPGSPSQPVAETPPEGDSACSNACFADYIVSFLSGFDENWSLTQSDLRLVVEAFGVWCRLNFSSDERAGLVKRLAGASYASAWGYQAASDLVVMLVQ